METLKESVVCEHRHLVNFITVVWTHTFACPQQYTQTCCSCKYTCTETSSQSVSRQICVFSVKILKILELYWCLSA